MKLPTMPAALALAASVACAGAANAETTPYAVGLAERLVHESNSAVARDDLAQSNLVSTTTLNFLLDQPIGRQRVTANAELGLQRFSDTKEWNNNPYRLGAELDWSTVDRWEGELGLDTGRQLYRYDQNTATPELNEEQSTRFWLRARVGVITTWTFESGLTAYDRDLSRAASDRLDQRQWAGEAGLRYRYSPDLEGRLMLRHTDGEYPRFSDQGADEFRRNDLELSAQWRPSGASRIDARVTWATESHTQQFTKRGSLWAGSLAWRWEPTGKLALVTTLLRDSDIGSSRFDSTGFADPSVGETQLTDSRIYTTLAMTAQWAATAKIRVETGARYTRRQLETDSSTGTSQRGNDATTSFSLAARYSPTRAIDLGCRVSRERRSVSGSSLALSYPYGNTTYGCTAEFWLR